MKSSFPARILRAALCALIIALTAVFPVLGAGCFALSRFDSSHFGCFDTAVTVTGYFHTRDEAEEEFEKIFADIEYCHRLFDIYHTYSGMNNISTVNSSPGEWVSLDAPLLELLVFSADIYEKTGGAVNIAMGSVLSVWHDAREADTPYLPDPGELRSAAQHTDMDALHIDPESSAVMIDDPLVRLDVGAVAKGFAAEYAAKNAETRGVSGILLNLGGNVRCIGEKPAGKWSVAIENPISGYPDTATLAVSDISVVTSGDYQRYFELDGVRYCHIIDPRTLYPAALHRSVTVVCADSALADALSTALFILDTDAGMALAASLGAQALWVDEGGITYSAGMELYIAD